MRYSFSISLALVAVFFAFCSVESANYFGKYIGPLKSYHHGLQGDVYVVDSRTLHIRNFNYDGEGPAGYFYVSNTKAPNDAGIKLRDERGSTGPLKKYRKKHITLTLPEGKTINNFKWFYVWCDEFSVNFGDVKIPKNLDYPKPQKIGKLAGVHSVSSDNIVVVDAQTLLIPAFSYDGEAPDAKFWVGSGSKPNPQGIRVPDENGKEEPLRKYEKKTIVLTLPGDITVFDIGYFGIWCEAFTVDFGHVEFPKDLNVPPSLKMLGVSPQSKLNCEILYDDLAFEVRWAVAGDSIVIQLVAKLEKGEYMSFGISGEIDRNRMVGGDVVVAWIDHETLNGFAYDYYLDAKSQCAGGRGSCPDVKLGSNTESIRLLNAALVNGYSIVTYQRPLRAHDEFDLPIYTNGSQAIIWAIGPLNSLQEVSYHSITSKTTTLIDFGRSPQWNCPIPESDASISGSDNNENYEVNTFVPLVTEQATRVQTESNIRSRVTERKEIETTKAIPKKVEATPAPVKREKPWDIPPIQCYEPEDGIFYAQMGPTGGKRGYPAITGHVGWGISWYINGLLIPEINVVRGRTYTFVVEGGLDPEIPAKYHPFYITDDPVGGFLYKTPEERAKVQIFAGVTQNKNGEYVPTGVGRLCNWTPDPDQPPADEFASFGAYQRTLSLVCDHGEPGVVQWTPDENTPDTVYYQCFSHRYLGWKINVHDTCDKEGAESEQVTTRIRLDENYDIMEEDLQSKPSLQVTTRVKPSNFTTYINEVPDAHKDRYSIYPEKSPLFKQPFKNELTETEQLILQDPYLPPPPYQKNFDYQSMQTTEPMKEIKSITEKTEFLNYTKSEAYMPNHDRYLNNNTTPQSVSVSKHKIFPYREPYPGYKASTHSSTSKHFHAPAMHIHIIKHADPVDDLLPPVQKSYTPGRPYHHSVVVKKPVHKIASHSYPPRINKVAKPIEPQVSGSVLSKSVLAPPLRGVIPKVPQGVLVSYNVPPKQTKKTNYVFTRKREEPKQQYLMNRIEEPLESKFGGFNPNSIVIEGGFKPIIPTPDTQNIAQDRMSEDSEDYIEQELKEINVSSESEKVAEDHSKNPFEGKQPELFEPIFIPSPVISEQQKKKKPETPKIKGHKPGQNIVYIWPMEEVANAPIKDSYYNNYHSINTISVPFYKEKQKDETVVTGNANIYPSVVNKPLSGVTHSYKVTEHFDNLNPEISDVTNPTDKTIQHSQDPEEKLENSSNNKVKYFTVSYTSKKSEHENDYSKFTATTPTDDENTEPSNSTVIKL